MIVDMDNGVDPNDNVAPDKEPKDRTVSRGLNRAYTCDTHERATPCQGTLTYCARSVAVGQYVVTFTSVLRVKMPTLKGEVKRQYEERGSVNPQYDAYSDAENTGHGKASGQDLGISWRSPNRTLITTFHRRPEHDAEPTGQWSAFSYSYAQQRFRKPNTLSICMEKPGNSRCTPSPQ